MTHRERFLRALQHKEADRIPVDLGANESSGIMAVAYNRLRKHLGISGRTQIYDPLCMTCIVEPAVLAAIGADAEALYILPKQWKQWTLADGSAADVQVVQGLGHGCDEAAMAALRASSFVPAYRGERPAAARVRIPYRFRMGEL